MGVLSRLRKIVKKEEQFIIGSFFVIIKVYGENFVEWIYILYIIRRDYVRNWKYYNKLRKILILIILIYKIRNFIDVNFVLSGGFINFILVYIIVIKIIIFYLNLKFKVNMKLNWILSDKFGQFQIN